MVNDFTAYMHYHGYSPHPPHPPPACPFATHRRSNMSIHPSMRFTPSLRLSVNVKALAEMVCSIGRQDHRSPKCFRGGKWSAL